VKRKAEFVSLFQEFICSYPYTPEGLSHLVAYNEQRQQGHRNFEAIALAAESGEELAEPILFQLFPNTVLTFDIKFQGSQMFTFSVESESYSRIKLTLNPTKIQVLILQLVAQIGQDILDFISHCNNQPHQLAAACQEFYQKEYYQFFPVERLTFLLNILQPENFLLLNNNSLKVINYFANRSYEQKLKDYPDANITGYRLIKELAKYLHQSGVPALREEDLFDMFCYWLVVVKNYQFAGNKPRSVAEVLEFTANTAEVELLPEYSLIQCAEETGFLEAELERWLKAIARKKQAIFYGSPGTGKTYVAEKLAQHLIGGGDGFWELVQFHPAYSYEDFIQGIRPQSQDGELKYPLVSGRFLQFCHKAESRQDLCVLIIDEINRANLAQVFGELMYLLEYRDRIIPLAAGSTLRIPDNVRIIGTMNTADRSIALVDHALRRRFALIELRPNYQVLRRFHQKKTGLPIDGLIEILKHLNNAIADKHYELGISFFLTEHLAEQIEDIWQMEIEPYLEEYFFAQIEKVEKFRWEEVKSQIFL